LTQFSKDAPFKIKKLLPIMKNEEQKNEERITIIMTKHLFTKEQKEQIVKAIKEAELNTSGEIMVHIEQKCKEEVLDRASGVFDMLNMQNTQLRNGVLFYLAVKDKKFAILGDAGINKKTGEQFWTDIKDLMHF